MMDLKKLKQEIDTQKKSSNVKREKLGEKVEVPVARDTFLHELLVSKDQGQRTNASERIRKVARLAEDKSPSESPQKVVAPVQKEQQQTVVAPQQSSNQTLADAINEYTGAGKQPITNSQERDDLFYRNMEEMKNKMRNMGMSEGDINAYVREQNPTQPQQRQNPQTHSAAPLNEDYIIEVASKKVEEFLNENFARIVSEAMKDTILETYKTERVLQALKENRRMVKDVVFEVIREIQEHQKKKKSA